MLSDYKKYSKRYHLTFSLPDFYNAYEKDKEGTLTKKQYQDFMKNFFELLRNEIIEERYHFNMPYRLGVLKIVKKRNPSKLNKHKVDWPKSKKLDKIVYHLNMHTDRYYFFWKWQKANRGGMRIHNRSFYKFRAVRKATRQLAHYIKYCASNPEVRDYDCLN